MTDIEIQKHNTEIYESYAKWLRAEGYNITKPLEVDAEHTIGAFLVKTGSTFMPVVTESEVKKLVQRS